MKYLKGIVFAVMITLTSCTVFDKSTRDYSKRLKRQVIPETILNTKWKLQSTTDDSSPCALALEFHGTGELTLTFKDVFYEGHFLMGKGDEFENLYVGFNPKYVWVGDEECVTNPSNFALYLNGGYVKFQVNGQELKIFGGQNKEFVFQKV